MLVLILKKSRRFCSGHTNGLAADTQKEKGAKLPSLFAILFIEAELERPYKSTQSDTFKAGIQDFLRIH